MRMRRILAFVLAVVMLMSNTVTASATSASTPISGNYNITTGEDGETIITPIDVEDGDEELADEGQETPSSSEGVEEPNGGDTGTGDEGSGDGGVGDDTGTPDGDDNNNDDVDSGEEGGDIDDPNGGDEDADDPDAPAEDEEITTEEETTTEELLAPGPLYEEAGDIEGDTIQNAGEIVEMAVNWEWDNARYFKSIANAIDWIDENGDSDPQTQYALGMVDDTEGNAGEFTVSGDDLVSTTKAAIWLNMSHGISVASDARVNISFNGGTNEMGDKYALNLAEGASLQILEGANNGSIFWNDVDIRFPESNAGDFIVGEKDAEVAKGDSVADIVICSGVNIYNAGDAYFYGALQYEHIYDSENDRLYEGQEVTFADVVIDLPAYNAETNYWPRVSFAVPVWMHTLDLNGSMQVKDLTVTNSMSATGAGSLTAFGDVSIANLTTTVVTEPYYAQFGISLNESYNDEYKQDNFIQAATLKLSGELNVDGRLNLHKAYAVFSDNGWFQEPLDYEIGDILVSVELGGDGEANASLTDSNNYSVYVQGMACYLEAVPVEGEDFLYNLIIREDYNQIRVYANTDEDDELEWQKGFEDFASLKNYISEQGIYGAMYYVHVNEDGLDVYENDLNYAGLDIGGISLELGGHSIDVVENAIVSVGHISGYVYSNGNRVNGVTSDINLPNEGTTLEIVPFWTNSGERSNIGGQGFRIISNNSVVKIGDPNSYGGSEAWFDADIVNELAQLHTYGRVSWESASQVVAREFYAENLSEEYMWQEAYIKNAVIGKLHAENGNVAFDKVNVTDTLYIRGGQTFGVKKGGAATVNNMEVIATYDSAVIELERQVKLAADDDYNWPDEGPSFEGATEVAKLGTLKITGDINVLCEDEQYMVTQISVRKVTGWEGPLFDGNGYPVIDEESGEQAIGWNAMTEEFKAGETIATVINTSVPARMFGIEGNYSYVQRSGTAMKAAKAVLIVRYEDFEDPENIWAEKWYTSFEDAVKNMPADFDEAEGRYIFTLIDDTKLTADVTVPNFVKELIFETECHEGNSGTRFQKFLDLNGKKFSTSAGIRMNGGVRICSSVSTVGKLVSTFNECALDISEDIILVDEDGFDIDREPVLDNVIVTTAQGTVDIQSGLGSDNILKASFDTKGFFVHQGRWTIVDKSATSKNYVKTTDFGVDFEGGGTNYFSVSQLTLTNGYGEFHGGMDIGTLTLSGSEFNMYGWVEADTVSVTNGNCRVAENGSLITKDLTLNNSVFAEGRHTEVTNKLTMTNGSRLDVWCDLHAKEISAAASKILVGPEGGGCLYTDKITISTAYAGDAAGDYTLQNNGQILVRDTLSMTAGTLENAGLIEANKLTLKDLNNSSFRCPDGGLGYDQFGHILCNTITNSGKVYLSRDTYLLINTSGTLNNVNVGDCYGDGGEALVGRSSAATVTFKGTFTRNNEDQQLLGFVTDEYVNNVGDYIVIGEGDGQYNEYQWDYLDLSDEKLIALEEDDLLFKTEISSFPVDAIRVLPWTVEDIDNVNNAVYQSGKELRITGEFIRVSIVTTGEESHLKDFTKWSDAVAYINILNNPTATYVIGIRADMDIDGTLTLPTKAAEVVICSDKGYEKEGEWIPEQARLSFKGDITQTSNLIFVNMDLEPYTLSGTNKVAYASTIDTKGKRLNLEHVTILKRATDTNGDITWIPGSLKAVKGTASTQFDLQHGTHLVVDTKISGINEIYLAYGSSLEVTGGISVNNLVTVNWGEECDNLIVAVNGASSVLEVKNRLSMFSPSEINCEGSMKIKDIYSNCSGNILRTAEANKIAISGRVLADNEFIDAAWQKETVYAVKSDNKIVGYSYTDLGGLTTAEKMPFAITIEAGDNATGTVLATAALVSPIWFISESNYENCNFDMTHKDGNNIISGSNTNTAVVLSAMVPGGVKEMNTFATLQDAFNEIDKIASTTTTYVITLNEDVVALNASKKLADYTFPKQAAEVIITSSGNAKTISYNKELKLQSNVSFENVVLSAYTTGGNVALDKFTLRLSGVDFIEQNADGKAVVYNITGSGVGKGSELVVQSCGTIAVAKLSKVDKVFLNDTTLSVGGDAEIGDLHVENQDTFIGLGKITIANICSSENPATIVTAPKLTLADIGKETERVTKVEANMTISGVIDGSVNFELYGIDANTNGGKLTFEKAGLDELANGAGIAFVKAVNANTEMCTVFNSDKYIYKKAGVFTYKSVDPQVTLLYDGLEIPVSFETFTDAVTEINNLKTKRNYTITFISSDKEVPVTLTMPKAGMVDTLTLTAKQGLDVYYVKDIKFDSNVLLDNINFVQVVAVDGAYVEKDLAIAMPKVDKFYDPVKVTVNGAYSLDVIGTVTFNTPIALSGAKKATFVLDGDETLFASAFEFYNGSGTDGMDIEGTVKDFAVLDVTNTMLVKGYLAGKYSADTWTYKAAELNVTTLNIANGANVEIGSSLQAVDSITVTNLNMSDGGLVSYGSGNFKYVTLTGAPCIEVYGQKFNITGTLTSATEDALLVTGLDAKKLTSVLNVSGSVVLQDPVMHSIWIDVIGPDDDFCLGGTYTDKDGKTQTYSNKLLTAAKANINAFIAYPDCVDGNSPYGWEEEAEGYILKKSGNDILVYYSDEVEVALYTLEEKPDEEEITATLCNYYISFNEAVTAIDSLKDTSADYVIELLNDVGGDIVKDAVTYEKINLPTKAASLTIYSVNGSAIYYNNDLALGCDTLISEVDLKPQVVNKKEKGIALKGYELVLDHIVSEQIGKITGNNKDDKLTIVTDKNLTIAGDLTGVADFELCKTDVNVAPEVVVTGKLTVKNLIFENSEVNLATEGKGSAITNIYSTSEAEAINQISFMEMTINGEIDTEYAASKVRLNNESVTTTAGYTVVNKVNKLDLVASSKLATIPKAALTNVEFYAAGNPVNNAQWSAKSVYNVGTNDNAVMVNKADGTQLLKCVDLSQAVVYIDTIADKNAGYLISITNDITDTNVTDTTAIGKIALPAKDKMSTLVVDGESENDPVIEFTGDIATNGVVTLQDIRLKNNADFSITNKKNSDVKKEGIVGRGELALNNVAIITYVSKVNGKDVVKGNLKNITGEKNATKLTVMNTVVSDLNAIGGITNIVEMTLNNTALTTMAKSDITTLKLASGGSWAGYGATVIGTVDNSEQNVDSYLGTYLVNGVPQLTINGSVKNPVKAKLFDFKTKTEVQASAYTESTPLVIAKTEAADKFIAEPFAGDWNYGWAFKNEDIQARKDAKNYVYNGNISEMEVLLISSVKGTDDTQTYVATYVDAINIINNIGNKNADYTIVLRATSGNANGSVSEIKTAGKDGVAAYGSLALPAANKAKSLTITSENVGNPVVMAYTGTMAPKCDLFFENIILTEGTTKTVSQKVEFTPSCFVTPALSTTNVNVTFGQGVSTLNANEMALNNIADGAEMYGLPGNATYGLVFSKVTSTKGSVLDVSGNAVYVISDAAIATLQAEERGVLSVGGKVTITDVTIENNSTMHLISKNAIKITNIAGEGELAINTTYTNKDWYKATPQLTIDGEMTSGTRLTIYQYMYDGDMKSYRLLNDDEVKDVIIEPEDKPAAYQKVIAAPKLQISDNVNIVTNAEQWNYYHLFKMDGVVYLSLYPAYIDVVGYDNEGEAYKGSFFTLEQAVKEIDKLNHGPSKTDNGWSYDIILRKDIGANANPIKTLSLPTKAAKVTIVGETGDEGIMMTGTSVSLKTDLDIRVPIVALKASGNNYYDTVYTLNAGNYDLELSNIQAVDFDNMGEREPQFKLSGSTKGTVTVIPAYKPNGEGTTDMGMIAQISGVGTVELNAPVNGNGDIQNVYYNVAEGITGVGELELKPAVTVGSINKDVNVKKLTMGESVGVDISNPMRAHIEAKNITVSDTLTMASSSMKAGTIAVGDGKVALTNVVFEDNHNNIEAKQDKNGKSQIQIKGTVNASGDNIIAQNSAVTIGLYYNNSSRNFAQLTEGMVLLTAPKAASSWFYPDYDNMGGVPMVRMYEKDEGGNTINEWEEPAFKLYKSGNDIKYGRVLLDGESGGLELIEARVWIGGRPGEASFMEFMTFEEAVKAIDSMGLQKTVMDEKGKSTKIYETYFVQIVNDVSIGNDKGDGKYATLPLPTKAAQVIIFSDDKTITFSGNVTLKCNTAFSNVNLIPMKTVKGVAEPTTANFAIGNFVMSWENSNCNSEWYDNGGLWNCDATYINNITGGAKGELVVTNGSKIKVNNITGLNAIRFEGYGQGVPTENIDCGQILTDGNISIKELHYQNAAGGLLRVRGNLTTNAIYVTGENNAQILKFADRTMKVNGVTLTQKDESGKSIKINESVIYSEDNTSKLVVDTYATSGTVLPGSKIINGKYLELNDWDLRVFGTPYRGYVTGNDLYLGTQGN